MLAREFWEFLLYGQIVIRGVHLCCFGYRGDVGSDVCRKLNLQTFLRRMDKRRIIIKITNRKGFLEILRSKDSVFFNGLLKRNLRRYERLVRAMIARLEFQCSGEIRTQFFISIERLKKKNTDSHMSGTCRWRITRNLCRVFGLLHGSHVDAIGIYVKFYHFFPPTSRCGYGRTPGSEWMNGGQKKMKNKIKSFRSIMLHRYPREQLVSSRHCSRRARAIINYRTRRWQYILPTDGSRPHNIMCLNCLKNSLPRQRDSSVVTVTWSRRTIGASRAAFEFQTPSNTG